MTTTNSNAAASGLIIIPFIDLWDMTRQAIDDALGQLEGRAWVLGINQGSSTEVRRQAEQLAAREPRFLCWHHQPPLTSLAATWNRALDFAWEAGYQDALVINNDVRIAGWMYKALRRAATHHELWFTTPVNCAKGEDPAMWAAGLPAGGVEGLTLGGPDFSCFLITRDCHTTYRFDERFQPAYFEDGDYHRRQWLGGDGDKIAGVTLPYLHYGSQTIRRSPEAQVAASARFQQTKQRYLEKWGGEPHHETFTVADDPASVAAGVGTPGGFLGEIPPPVTVGVLAVEDGA